MLMAYNNSNQKRYIEYVFKVYNQYKAPDVPDSKIVKKKFPEHGIFLSYSGWMNIKNSQLKN